MANHPLSKEFHGESHRGSFRPVAEMRARMAREAGADEVGARVP